MTGRRRLSKRKLKVIAWAASLVGFALPWAAFEAVPKPAVAAPQVVVIPAGSRVVTTKPAPGKAPVYVVAGRGATTGPPVTTTGGSHPPP